MTLSMQELLEREDVRSFLDLVSQGGDSVEQFIEEINAVLSMLENYEQVSDMLLRLVPDCEKKRYQFQRIYAPSFQGRSEEGYATTALLPNYFKDYVVKKIECQDLQIDGLVRMVEMLLELLFHNDEKWIVQGSLVPVELTKPGLPLTKAAWQQVNVKVRNALSSPSYMVTVEHLLQLIEDIYNLGPVYGKIQNDVSESASLAMTSLNQRYVDISDRLHNALCLSEQERVNAGVYADLILGSLSVKRGQELGLGDFTAVRKRLVKSWEKRTRIVPAYLRTNLLLVLFLAKNGLVKVKTEGKAVITVL